MIWQASSPHAAWSCSTLTESTKTLFFYFFERSIGQANEKVTKYLREFKEALSEGNREAMGIATETGLMIEVDDILDELQTLKLVLTGQKTVIEDLNRTLKVTANAGGKCPSVEMRTLNNHLVRIEQMEQAARKVDKLASLTEALYVRESAIDTARQGKIVIVFTVVTILFLPVSLIASVFAINTNGFPLDSNDRIPFDYLMKHIVAIELRPSVPLIVIAFNVDRIAGWLKTLRDARGHLLKLGFGISAGVALFLAILGPVWASQLSSDIKAAVSILISVLAAMLVLAYGFYRLLSHTTTLVSLLS
ncbi:ankyrin repeat and protein kinase domain-containing protein [Colletotrichum graminicola]|nr:ankyrin repeat and protein kinase domain-containing protein [Colletotrichum graminicola]